MSDRFLFLAIELKSAEDMGTGGRRGVDTLRFYFVRDGLRYGGATAITRGGVPDPRVLGHGHAVLLAVCRLAAGLGIVGLVIAVAAGAGVLAGAPTLLLGWSVVAFLGTRATANAGS